MPASKNLRDAGPAGGGRPLAAVTTVGRKGSDEVNYGSGDVRGRLDTRVITINAATAGDSFKIRAIENAGRRQATDTAAFVIDTNSAAADLQAELRTATGDTGLTVTDTAGGTPYTVTFSDSPHRSGVELQLVELVGVSGNITSGVVTYRNRGTNTELTAQAADTAAPGYAAGQDVPLGQSPVTNGVGQTARAEFVRPTIDSAVGGNDQVVVAGTVHASDGTSGVITYTVYRTDDDVATGIVTEDADGDVTISSLESAVDYYVVGVAQTDAPYMTDQVDSRVSPATPREYFTTT
jgi:hypothetical protein